MKNNLFYISIKKTISFYFVFFLFQAILFFVFPPFHVGSPSQTNIPFFIKLTFAKYFGGTLILYLTWGLFLGLLNALALKILLPKNSPQSSIPFYSLILPPFFLTLLTIFIFYPSALISFPLLKYFSLALIYLLILTLTFLLCFQGYRHWQVSKKTKCPLLVLNLGVPVFLTFLLLQPARLNLPSHQNLNETEHPDIFFLGFDALDGDSGNQAIEKAHPTNIGGIVFANAFTPLPLTHPAWNSILSGLYPPQHRARFFFTSPQPPLFPQLYLPWRLKTEAGYQTVFASDQPETSYFNSEQGFDQFLFSLKGWKAHLHAMFLNHFVLPAIWLNNPYAEKLLHRTINTPSLFNFDLARFYNFSFENLSQLPTAPKMMALHTCYLHTPIRLNFWELSKIPHYLLLSPRMFSFAKWPKPGTEKEKTPENWVNPYYVRRELLLRFFPDLLNELESKNYFKNSLVVFLSDHGERFLEGYEVYGGIHGVDLKTRAQNNVVATLFDSKIHTLRKVESWVSLVDLTPTVLQRVGLTTKPHPYDGVALLDQEGKFQPPEPRPIWVETMGWIEDHSEKNKFPQISIQTLEESLHYQEDGTVTIGDDYYSRVLQNKQISDLTQTPSMNERKEAYVPKLPLPHL